MADMTTVSNSDLVLLVSFLLFNFSMIPLTTTLTLSTAISARGLWSLNGEEGLVLLALYILFLMIEENEQHQGWDGDQQNIHEQ